MSNRRIDDQSSSGDDTRATILDAACDLIERYGLRKTTMEDIARELGKKKSFLYYYFSGKRDLVAAMASRVFSEISREVREDVKAYPKAADQVRAFLVSRVVQFTRRRGLLAQMLDELRGGSRELDFFRIADERRRFEELEARRLERIIRRGVADGEFRALSDSAIDGFCRFALAAVRGIEVEVVVGPNLVDDLQPRLEQACELLMNGLLKPTN